MILNIGVDIGATGIKAGLVNGDYKIIGETVEEPTQAERSESEIIDNIRDAILKLSGKNGISMDKIGWIGMGCPGAAKTESGIVVYSPNLPTFKQTKLVMHMENRLQIPTYIDNDGNAAAMGERIAGVAKGASSIVAMTLGTGVGTGLIVDGKTINGINGAAGEGGHIRIQAEGGRLCACGKIGCIEAYCSATALINMAFERMITYKESIMWKLCEENIETPEQEKAYREIKNYKGSAKWMPEYEEYVMLIKQKLLNAKIPFDAEKTGELAATDTIREYMFWLSVAVSNFIVFHQPEKLVLAGGVSRQGQYLLDKLIPLVQPQDYAPSHDIGNRTDIVTSTHGNEMAIIGAASLGEGKVKQYIR